MTPPDDDAAFARWLAVRTGRELLALRARLAGAAPAVVRAEADRRAHESIVAQLARWRSADAVLSEEQEVDDPARLTASRVWIVDPLDGTRGFGEPGRVDWAVHIALWERDRGLVAGAVALPAQDRVLATDDPPPYPPPATGRPLRIAVSRTRAPRFTAALAAELGAEAVPLGSAGAKTAAVVAGEVDAYLHADGQYEWDSAAPVAVARAAGLHASRLDGTELAYNRPDPYLPDLLICRREVADRLLAAVATVRR
jgi:3'(2'), 5'-bisphosphate nucleotidase